MLLILEFIATQSQTFSGPAQIVVSYRLIPKPFSSLIASSGHVPLNPVTLKLDFL
jgi:hypothetical protein